MRRFLLWEEQQIKNYLDSVNYSGLQKYNQTNNTSMQSIDQKVTFDALNTTCKCIIHYVGNNINCIFHHNDFLNDKFSRELYSRKKAEYGAAKLDEKTKKEYDKLFWNIFESLSYVGILKKVSQRPRKFKIINYELVKLLADSIEACVCYVCINALHLIESMGIFNQWNALTDDQFDNNKKLHFKTSFIEAVKNTTGHEADISQIFQKVINPLYYLFELEKYDTNKFKRKCHLLQSVRDLAIFRIHRRDQRRISGMTRRQMAELVSVRSTNPSEEAQKEKIKRWNQQYYGLSGSEYVSEYSERHIYTGIVIHHIKMKTSFNRSSPVHKHIVENLIIMTPTEHASYAHKNGNTHILNESNLNRILWAQYSKILNFTKENIGQYKLEPFYKLACYIKGVNIEQYKNEDMLKEYIEDVISI